MENRIFSRAWRVIKSQRCLMKTGEVVEVGLLENLETGEVIKAKLYELFGKEYYRRI